MKDHDLLTFEKKLTRQGYRYIAGVDEVGRGPLAGGVLACACILDLKQVDGNITDSKQLTEKKRLLLNETIMNTAVSFAYGYVNEKEIDEINIYQASRLAMLRAVKALKVKPDYLLVDAMSLDIDIDQKSIIKGDTLSASIGAASILAKVKRDEIMEKFHELYPHYGFNRHKGYPTPDHIKKLNKHKPCAIHRMTYKPVQKSLLQQVQLDLEMTHD